MWKKEYRSGVALALALSCSCGGEPPGTAASSSARVATTTSAHTGATTSASATSVVSASPSGSASSAPAPTAFEKATVAASDADGVSTAAFGVERFAGDADKNWLEAGLLCHEHQRSLCTATQWARAVASDPAIGAFESWTASADGKLAKVMGGGAARTVDPKSRDVARGALCCDAAVAWTPGKNPDPTFQSRARTALTRYATALEKRDMGELEKIYGLGLWLDHPIEDGANLSHVAAVAAQKSWFAAHPKLWSVYDRCSAEVGPVPALAAMRARVEDGIVVRCTVVTALEKELSVAQQILGWSTLGFDSTPELIMLQHMKLDTIKF